MDSRMEKMNILGKVLKQLKDFPETYNFMEIGIPESNKDKGCILGWTAFYSPKDYETIGDACLDMFGVCRGELYSRFAHMSNDRDWVREPRAAGEVLKSYMIEWMDY